MWYEYLLDEKRNDQSLLNQLHFTNSWGIEDNHSLDLRSSIGYARKIQNSILPDLTSLQSYLPGIFLINQPKHIVSGDFYWFMEMDGLLFLAMGDCTGHGVPGAFMSMIGTMLLRFAVKEKKLKSPEHILQYMHKEMREVLKQYEGQSGLNDGMDIAICVFNRSMGSVEFSGANRPLLLYSEKEGLIEVKGEKYGLGGRVLGVERTFSHHSFSLRDGDILYLFSDGYQDQFGGDKNKKFSSKRLRNLLSDVGPLDPVIQSIVLRKKLIEWKGIYDQTDDILLIGIPFTGKVS